jgi:NAD(P)-dependent dehydrogenase (short-subunit alcohol dehydrogenase family)
MKHVVITGAGTGIGRAIAQEMTGEKVALSLLGRRLEPLEETSSVCHGHTRVYRCDIRDAAAVQAVFAQLAADQGPVHALVANAGIGGANLPGPADRFTDLVATNLTGTYHCLRAAQAHLEAGPASRHFVVIASILARIGVAGYTGYCASKAALLGLTRALAMELAPENVQVNAVCPGWVNTAMAHEGLEGMASALGVSKADALTMAMSDVPLGRMSQPVDIARFVGWLCSDAARGVTGQGLDINNGAFMM